MARPDPRMVPRLPMARRQTHVTWTHGETHSDAPRPLFFGTMLNLDALHGLIERSETLSEGRIEETRSGDRLFGSTVITLDLETKHLTDEPSEALAEALKNALDDDARVRRILDARLYREIARLVGHRASGEFDSQIRIIAEGYSVKIHSDFDMSVTAAGVVGE